MFTTPRRTRPTLRRLLAGGAGVAAVVSLTAGVSLAGGGDEPPPPAPTGNVHPGDSFDADELHTGTPVGQLAEISGNGGAIVAEALAPASGTLSFVPVAPCRAVDTRPGLPMQAGVSRNFTATSTNMSGQGGSVTGCKVPAWADAVAVNYAVVGPALQGFGKAWETGTGEPATSVINFAGGASNAATANSGVLAFSNGGQFTVELSRQADLLVDITGFYIRDLYGSITFDGDVLAGSSLIDFVDHDPLVPGVYTVDFGAFVEGCVPQVTPSSDQHAVRAAASSDPNENDQIIVDVEASDGTGGVPGDNVDGNFHISVSC